MKMVLIFIFLFSCHIVRAENVYSNVINSIIPVVDLPNAELELLRKDLKIQSILMESIQEIQFSGGQIKDIDKATGNIQRSIGLAFEARTINLEDRVKTEVKELIETTISPKKLKHEILKITNFLKNDFIKKGITMSSLTRRFGIQIGIFYLAMVQLDYTIPMILMSTGHVALGAKLFALPISSATTALFAAAKSAIRYRHILKELGLAGTRELFNISKLVKNSIDRSIFASNYPIEIIVGGKQFKINVQETRFISRLFIKLGYKKYLDYHSLLSFLQENDLYRGFTRRIINSTEEEFSKAINIIKKIEHGGDLEVLVKLKKKFGRKVAAISGIVNLDHQVSWALKLAYAKNVDDVFKLLGEMPKDLAPRSFNKLWREFIFPSMAESFGNHTSINHHRSFHKLSVNYDRNVWGKFSNSINYEFLKEDLEILKTFFYDSFSPLNSCGQVYMGSKFL